MPSTFLALEIGNSALNAAMMGAETAGHNIANANTPGYSRQVLDAVSQIPLTIWTDHLAFLGQGVNGRGVNQVDNQFVDDQYRDNNSQQSYWEVQNTEINSIGQIFNEPTGTTLRQAMDNYFSAWNQLAGNPTDTGTRSAVFEAGSALVDAFHNTATALSQNQARYAAEMSSGVDEINSIAQSIAALNVQIDKYEARGGTPNDLLDQRKALLDKLSNYASVQVTYTPDPTWPTLVRVTVGLVQSGGGTYTLVNDQTVTPLNPVPAVNPTPAQLAQIANLVQGSGSLRSQYDMYQYVQNVQANMDALANSIINDVNAQQAAGTDLNGNPGAALFAGAGAAGIQLAAGTNPSQLAAAGPAQPANSTDNTNAQIMAALPQPSSKNYDGIYAGDLTQIGVDGQHAKQQQDTFAALTTQATQLQQSISGVNINEEMSNLIRYQQTYGAAAKFVSVFNDMLQTLINNA